LFNHRETFSRPSIEYTESFDHLDPLGRIERQRI
jgi:hypothetical protein